VDVDVDVEVKEGDRTSLQLLGKDALLLELMVVDIVLVLGSSLEDV
jgi:hypothetical protein